ncbi:MAG: RDD family protein [bacterium]|nr:RDD family protein [bacterium]
MEVPIQDTLGSDRSHSICVDLGWGGQRLWRPTRIFREWVDCHITATLPTLEFDWQVDLLSGPRDAEQPASRRSEFGRPIDGVVGARIAAALIDLTPLYVLLFGVAARAGELERPQGLLMALVALAYFVIPEVVWGTSPGKRVMGLQVTSVDGNPVGWAQSLLRNLLRFVDWFPSLYLLGMVSITASRRDQRIGDRAAKTVVQSWLVTAASDIKTFEDSRGSNEAYALFAFAAATSLIGIGLLLL